jgi:hypothetical protein
VVVDCGKPRSGVRVNTVAWIVTLSRSASMVGGSVVVVVVDVVVEVVVDDVLDVVDDVIVVVVDVVVEVDVVVDASSPGVAA